MQALFEQALHLPAAERDRYLEQECGDDRALREQVDALLRAHAEKTGALRGVTTVRDLVDIDRKLEGTLVQAWRLIERIGAGGMGTVFRAERADGAFERTVALKVVKKGMDTESVLRRFRMERQILARLHHPNIAGMIDGGGTEDGRPYFVMEYVAGLPVTEYCDYHHLGIRERLDLFMVICRAVHYAHQSLVVHRDLKPSNILVTPDGHVKLLDFGVAKLLDDSDEQQSTRTSMQMMTPAYASPEQLLNKTVTTQTDIYALGVILYELLSGRRPYEVRRTAEEFRRSVLDDDPASPSIAVTKVPLEDSDPHGGRTAEQVGQSRGLDVDRLRKMLKGDLDTICLVALRREPEKRYPSADQMAVDVRRYLDGQPVAAQADRFSYRLGKFVRRNRRSVITAVGVVGVFGTLVTFYTLRLAAERDVALAEQQKTAEVVSFVTGLFQISDPAESRGEEISARDILDAGTSRVQYELTDRPEVQATMLRVLGEVYYELGDDEKAEELLRGALERLRRLHGDEHLDVATTKVVLGFIYQDRGELDAADAQFREARATRQSLLGHVHHDVMEAISVQAYLEEAKGNYEEAGDLYRESLALARQLYSGDDGNVAEAMTKLGGLYRLQDRVDDAEQLLREALAMQQRVYGGPHPEIDSTKRQLAGLLRDTRRFDDASRLYQEVIDSRVRMLGPDHMEVAHTWNSYSQLLQEMGDLEGAITANRNFVDIVERVHDGPHPSLGAAYNNIGLLLRDQGELDGALEYLQMSVDMQDAVALPPRHPNRSYPLANIADIYLRQRRFTEAETLLRNALAIRRENFPEEHTLISEAKSGLGEALTNLGNYAEAESLLLDAHARFLNDRGADDPRTKKAAELLTGLEERRATEESL